MWELIGDQIENLRAAIAPDAFPAQQVSMTRERIRQLGQELDRIASTAILEKRFGKAA